MQNAVHQEPFPVDDGTRQRISAIVKSIKVCAKLRDWKAGEKLHRTLVKTGDFSNIYVANTLVDMYAKCGRMCQARWVFNKIPEPSVVSWNCLLMGYVQSGQSDITMQLCDEMQEKGMTPDAFTLVSLLKACSSLAHKEEATVMADKHLKVRMLEKGRRIHKLVIKTGHELDTCVYGSLLDMYCKCGSMEDALKLFHIIPQRDVVCWTAMILGYADCGKGELALEFFNRMQDQGLVPDMVTFIAALKACSVLSSMADPELKRKCLERGRRIHSQAVSICSNNMHLESSLVDMYAKCGSMRDARIVFDSMPKRDVVAWTAIIMGYAQSGEGEVALQLYARMMDNKWGCKPNDVTFAATLKACGTIGAFESGKQVHADAVAAGYDHDELVVGSLVDFYARCSKMEEAEQVFGSVNGNKMRNLAAWGALVAGYGRQGDVEGAFHVLERMKQQNVQPNSVILLSVLTACSHSGLVDEGKKCFEAMTPIYNIVPVLKHYNSMVDILGRGNRLQEAMQIINNMPLEPDKVTWTTLLSACHKWKQVDLAKYAFEKLLTLGDHPSNIAPACVLMASIYRSLGLETEAEKLCQQHQHQNREYRPEQQPRSWWVDDQKMVHCFAYKGVELQEANELLQHQQHQ